MNRKLSLVTLLLLVTLLVAACGGSSSAPDAATDKGSTEAMAGNGDAMAEDGSGSMSENGDSMAEDGDAMTGGSSGAMAEDGDSMAEDGDVMAEDGKASMDGEAMMDLPAWFQADLTDVNTGQTFSLADFQGKVVLVETMAIWCSNCLRQQREVRDLHQALGERDDLVTVGLDIDANEDEASLKEYTARQGFNWIYAVAPREVASEIGRLYGDHFLNPPSTPMLIVDRRGAVHPLPFGHKTVEDLQAALEPFLGEGM